MGGAPAAGVTRSDAAAAPGLLDKLRAFGRQLDRFPRDAARPFSTVVDEVIDAGRVRVGGREVLMLGSNNYLGLTRHPEVVAAARGALLAYGTGTTGSRVANGTLALHRALEADLAALFGKPHVLTFTTGHQANTSMLAGLCAPGDTILLDAESHASLHDGARLSGATILAFRHEDMDDLERKLRRLPAGATNRLVVMEGLYSISADKGSVADAVVLCRRYGAYLLVDEAHAFGVLGACGRGVCEEQGVLDQVDFVVGTFSKSLGATGGFAVSHHPELAHLHLTARSYVFTAAPAPATVAGVRAALAILDREPGRRQALAERAWQLRSGLASLGLSVGPRRGDAATIPIVPVDAGRRDEAIALWSRLFAAGLYVNLVLPPACPEERCLLRASVSAEHTPAQIDLALGVVARVLARPAAAPPAEVR